MAKYKALKFKAKGVYIRTRLSLNIDNNTGVCQLWHTALIFLYIFTRKEKTE